MRRRLLNLWASWQAWKTTRNARAFHRAMGHSCDFCQPKRKDGACS